MVFVGRFGAIGVYCVSIVAGHEEAVGNLTAIVVAIGDDAAKNIGKQGGCCALLGLASHFLVVKEAVDGEVFVVRRFQKSGERGKSALQIVKTGSRDEVAPFHTRLGVIDKQIGGENVLLVHGCRFGDAIAEGAFLPIGAKKGKHIHRGVVGGAVVGVAVHVDSDTGNDGAGVPQVNELNIHAALGTYRNASRDRQRSVHPRGTKHAAVFFGGKAHIAAVGKLGVFLDLEARAVAMGGGHHEAIEGTLWHTERNKRGAVTRDEIAFACRKLPIVAFAKLLITLLPKDICRVCHRMICRGRGGNIVK